MIGTLEQALQDMKNGVTDFTDNGKCSQCGQCCSNILPMSEKEVRIIRRYIKANHIKPQKISALYVTPMLDMTCPFMRKDVSKERCTIYPVRPEICKQFKCDNTHKGKRFDDDGETRRIVDVWSEFYGGK